MASYQLNVARLRGCPPAGKLAAALKAFGLPESEEFGVLNVSATSETVFATVVRKSQQAVPQLDPASREVTAAAVEKVTVYPLGIRPAGELLETYAGSAAGLEQVGVFLASCLALPTVVEAVELDVPAAVRKLSKLVQRFQLRSVRVSEYAHSSYMSGPYAPKFLDSEHGMDFLEEYADFVTTASVRFDGPTGRANAALTPKTCFRFSCNEDDQSAVQSILRKLT